MFYNIDTRVTMKMDVSYTDHSHIIGKGGELLLITCFGDDINPEKIKFITKDFVYKLKRSKLHKWRQ